MKYCLHCLVLLAVLLAVGISLTVNALDRDKVITNCDTNGGWVGVSVDTGEKTEGQASLAATFRPKETGGIVISYNFAAVNAGGLNTLEFDLYLSDPEVFEHAGDCSIELTSSGTCDVQETSWSPQAIPLTEGWNHLVLPIRKGSCITSRINFFRIYGVGMDAYTDGEVTIRLDNMRLTYTDPALFGPTVPAEDIGYLDEAAVGVDAALPSLTPLTVSGTESYRRAELGTVAMALFGAAGALLVAFVFLLCFKKKTLGVASLVLCLLLAGGGAYAFVTYRQPLERETQVPIPQMDMAQVEAMLTKTPDLDKTEAYKILYSGVAGQVDPDSKWNFRTPTLVESAINTDQYYVAVTTPQAFGAVGDGVADDTQAFLDAIAYAEAQGGGTVFVPAGRYCLTAGLTLPIGVTLVGELEKGTVNGTVLMIYHGKGDENAAPAIGMNFHSGVKNMAFWYPEQTFVGGEPIPYPWTIRQLGSEGITLENLNFVNAYKAIDMQSDAPTSNSLQTVRDICGTPLVIGTDNTHSLDIGRFEGIDFAPEYWLLSGLEGVPAQQLLTTWLLRNATAIRIGRVDWTYYTDVTVKGYSIGIEFYIGPTGSANGHLYRASLTECYYPVYSQSQSHLNFTDVTLSAVGNEGAVALYFGKKATTTLSLNSCDIRSEGKNAIYNPTSSTLSLLSCAVASKDGSPLVITDKAFYAATNTTFEGANAEAYRSDSAEVAPLPEVDYRREVVTKPTSDRFIDLTQAPYSAAPDTDISDILQQALDDLKATGGTLYLPAGEYTVSKPITVHAGIEICGVQDVPHYFPHTTILTDYGYESPDAPALFTLKDGAGLRGLGIQYHVIASYGANVPAYAYTVRGDGRGVYIVNCTIPFAYNGVDFATNRCDDHYVEYLWGCAANNAIQVGGGSENGIIRDCMFTQNTSWTVKGDAGYIEQIRPTLIDRSVTFRVGETKNQIVYHTFVYAAYKGLEITDGAQNCVVISHGTDCGNNAIYVSGNATVTLIDPQMVAMVGGDMRYLQADETFCGTLTVYNAACWGTPRSAIVLKGNGQYRFYQTYFANVGTDVFTLKAGSLELVAMTHLCTGRYDVVAEEGVTAITIAGSLVGEQLNLKIPASVILSGDDVAKKD